MELMDLTETLPVFSLFSLSCNPVQPFPQYQISQSICGVFGWQCDKQSYWKMLESFCVEANSSLGCILVCSN